MLKSPSASPEEEWLKKAIDQLKSGIPFFVRFVGKIELPCSIAEEPDPDNRISIVCGCLRKVAQSASILDDSYNIPEIAEKFLENAKIIVKNVEVQLSIYDNVFTIGDHVTNKFFGRHKIADIAFAHLDSEARDIFGYYALERKVGKDDTRFYYVIQSESGLQVLAAMKLAFTVYAEKRQNSGEDVDVFKIAESMTPSPSTPTGAYCLLRLSTPSSDGTGFIHQITPIDSERLHQQVKMMALSDRIESRIIQNDIINPTTSIQNITNIYLNMDDFRRINPYNSNQMYPEVSEIPETLKPKKPEIKKVFELPEFPETHENDIEEEEDYGYGEGYAEDNIGRFATYPPIPLKSANALKRQQQICNENSRIYVPQQPSQDFYAHPPSAPVPQFRHPDATVHHPTVRSRRENNYDSEIERLKQKEKQLQERIRQIEIENQKAAQQIEIPPLPPRRKRRVKFRTIKEAFQFRAQKMALPFKKRFGNLRLSDYDESVLASEYTSLNSQSFDGSISTSAESSSASDASSQDSGVHDDLFVFPEAPENSLHWTNRLFRKGN
uniref:PID domain-containing protein n=1 Tax=Panagrolaimus sp. PS1159 TaxID=55785 RepID=A0AC35G465_9BILA